MGSKQQISEFYHNELRKLEAAASRMSQEAYQEALDDLMTAWWVEERSISAI